jgi:hypothetical protein
MQTDAGRHRKRDPSAGNRRTTKNIVQFLEMSMRKHMLVDSIIGANPARNVAVRVSLERWPVKLYVLEYMARCQNPSRT